MLAPGAPAQTEKNPSSETQPHSGRFNIKSASTRADNGLLVLDADLEITFSSEAIEAIENGVSVSILLEMEVMRERSVWNEIVGRPVVTLRIENNPLTTQYTIRNLDDGTSRTFSTRARMLDALGKVRGMPAISLAELSPRERYSVRVRARLDIEALPAPLRPLAYLSPLWRLRSDWYTVAVRRTAALTTEANEGSSRAQSR